MKTELFNNLESRHPAGNGKIAISTGDLQNDRGKNLIKAIFRMANED